MTAPAPTQKKKADRLQHFICKFFSIFAWLDDNRLKHPLYTRVFGSIPAFILSLLIPALPVLPPATTPAATTPAATTPAATTPAATTPAATTPAATTPAWAVRVEVAYVFKWGTSLLLGLLVSEVFFRGIVPTLRFTPQSLMMRELGMHAISAGASGSFENVVRRYIVKHESNTLIRIICISGDLLFRREKNLQGEDVPLHRLAEQGKLDVLMPSSSTTNPTVKSRYNTYLPQFKSDNRIDTIEKFLGEIEDGKSFLKRHNNNVKEHSMLCMWRVVLFSEHCIVQNYFPNKEGTYSYLAPIFVFEKREVTGSYYAAFETMFALIKEISVTAAT